MQEIFPSRLSTIIRLTIALLAFAGLASADSMITVPGVDWNLGENIWLDANGTPNDAYFAGLIYINLTQNGQQYDRNTLCVDYFTDIYIGQNYETEVMDPSQVPNRSGLGQVAWLIDNALLPGQGQTSQSSLPSSDWVTTVAQGAGIQLAIWDITTNGAVTPLLLTDPNSGGNQTDPAVAQWAATYLALSAGQTSNLAYVYNNWDPNSGNPAQMLEGAIFADSGPSPVPEPNLCIWVGGLLVALSVVWRKRT